MGNISFANKEQTAAHCAVDTSNGAPYQVTTQSKWLRLHDLRRTMVTTMNDKLGVPPHIVEAVVNRITGPAKSGVAGIYNKALYLEDRRKALNKWNKYIESITS